MSEAEYSSLLTPGPGERFEDSVEDGIDRFVEAGRWTRNNPRKASAIAAGALALWMGVQFGIPWAINKYHEVRASNDIEQAEEQLFSLTETQATALEDLDENRFIIIDELEPGLDAKISDAGEAAAGFVDDINSAKDLFEQGQFREVRMELESDYDDAHQGPGLIDLISAEIPLVATVSDYSTTLRDKRDAALTDEVRLVREMDFQNNGYENENLQNALGGRLRSHEPTLTFILDIALRPGVSRKANGMFDSARSSFVSAAFSFHSDSFVHYTSELDGTMDQGDYDSVLLAQRSVFGAISSGDTSLSSLVSYKGTLTEQWFTVVERRWEDSHKESYEVMVDNPAYNEWQERVCDTVCTTKYCSERYCRQRATDGGIEEDCTTVQEPCGQDCEEKCDYEHRDNGQPKRIPETRWRTIPEYWVKVDTHTTRGVRSKETDLEDEGVWNRREHKLGFQEWKPFGDDREYQGFGGIGPNGEKPYIMQKR